MKKVISHYVLKGDFDDLNETPNAQNTFWGDFDIFFWNFLPVANFKNTGFFAFDLWWWVVVGDEAL